MREETVPSGRRSTWSEWIAPALVVAVPVLYVLGLAYESGFLYSLGYGDLGFDGMVQLPISWQDYTKSAATVLAAVIAVLVLVVLGLAFVASLGAVLIAPALITWRSRRVQRSAARVGRNLATLLSRTGWPSPKWRIRWFAGLALPRPAFPLNERQRIAARHVWVLVLGCASWTLALLRGVAGAEFIVWPATAGYAGFLFAGAVAYVMKYVFCAAIAVLSSALLLPFFFGKKGATFERWRYLNDGPLLAPLLTMRGCLALLFVALAPGAFDVGVVTGQRLISAAQRATHRISWKQADRLEQDDVTSTQALRIPQFGVNVVEYWPLCERLGLTLSFCYRTTLTDP